MEEKQPDLIEVDLTPEQLIEKRNHLENCKMSKDDSDLTLEKYEAQLDAQLPIKLLDDSIKEIKKNLAEKKFKNRSANGTESEKDATDAELEVMKIELKSMEKMKKLDLPMRDLRLRIAQLKRQKEAFDAPEQQIHKLEREIKTKKATIPRPRDSTKPPVGVG